MHDLAVACILYITIYDAICIHLLNLSYLLQSGVNKLHLSACSLTGHVDRINGHIMFLSSKTFQDIFPNAIFFNFFSSDCQRGLYNWISIHTSGFLIQLIRWTPKCHFQFSENPYAFKRGVYIWRKKWCWYVWWQIGWLLREFPIGLH